MAKFRIYLVENDLKYGRFLEQAFLQNADLEVIVLSTGKDCLDALDKTPDLICIDFALSDMHCDELLSKLVAYNMHLSVLVFKVKDNANVAVEFLKLGATDYILQNEQFLNLPIDAANLVSDSKYIKDKIETFEQTVPATVNLEYFDSDKKDSKIVKELKAIVVMAAVLGNEKRINIIGLNSLHPKSTNFIVPTEKTLREYSIGIIVYYLEKYNQNVVKVAEKLDIGKSTIYNMIKSGEITLNK